MDATQIIELIKQKRDGDNARYCANGLYHLDHPTLIDVCNELIEEIGDSTPTKDLCCEELRQLFQEHVCGVAPPTKDSAVVSPDPDALCAYHGQRLIDWVDDPNRKPANEAFTAGNERQVAYRFERVTQERGSSPDTEAQAREAARQCGFAASRYFDELYLASAATRAAGKGFDSSGVDPHELASRFEPIFKRLSAGYEDGVRDAIALMRERLASQFRGFTNADELLQGHITALESLSATTKPSDSEDTPA